MAMFIAIIIKLHIITITIITIIIVIIIISIIIVEFVICFNLIAHRQHYYLLFLNF
jgi:hypothetical protein